jgi:hypothetical protein
MSGTNEVSETSERAQDKERGKHWLPAELAELLRVQTERLSEFRGRL